MSAWNKIIMSDGSSAEIWQRLFDALCSAAVASISPVTLHDATVEADRLLAEAASELWDDFPQSTPRTAILLREWAQGTGKAVLILDAFSLREFSLVTRAAELHDIKVREFKVTGAECPTTTDAFAQALGVPSRSKLANNNKPGSFTLFSGNCHTDVVSLPFEDYAVSSQSNVVVWHTWLDDLIHLHKKTPDQVAKIAAKELLSDGFWNFVNRLRKGRKLVITSDHGYATSSRFSSAIEEPASVKILRETFGASRCVPATKPWTHSFMPPVVMTCSNHHVIMGQRKWQVQGGFPSLCHGGMSLLEAAVPWIELEAIP